MGDWPPCRNLTFFPFAADLAFLTASRQDYSLDVLGAGPLAPAFEDIAICTGDVLC
jgi:hypothetical protein